MAKSWGARIVGRLFGSRSHKKADAEGNETPTLEDSVKDSLLQHDSEPYEALSTKDSEKDLNQFEPETGDEAAPTKSPSEAQLNVGKPDTGEIPTLSEEPGKENADEPLTRLSNSAPMPKPSPVQVHKSQNGPLLDKASGVGVGPATDETSDGKSVISNSGRRRKRDHGAQRKVANEVPTKVPAKADIKALTDFRLETSADELASTKDTVKAKKLSPHGDLPRVVQEREEKSAAPKAKLSAMKRSHTQKPKAMDGQVTDEELAELEAENARLKLLLHEKLQSNALQS
ncbi:hypothetical protein [Ochrobactrum sp. MYb379]|uniref:hypothetical protein n=1 Tax=Ochrobactrum sp. MYb379 TaxID=2745275 RepID=UPI0030B0F442